MADTLIDELCRTAKDLAQRGLVSGTGGNISVRDDDRVVISARGADLATLTSEQCVIRSVRSSTDAPGSGTPSSELPLHRAAYEISELTRAVVHTHSRYAIVMSTVCDVLPAVHYMGASLGGAIRVAPYERFGTDALASGAGAALRGRKAALLRNHGGIAVGSDLRDAASAAITLEWLAELAYLSRVAGDGTVLDEEEIEAVRQRSMNWGNEHHGR